MGSWQHREVQIALDRQAREPDFPVIPILLSGLDDEPTGFLSLQTWIDLRADLDDPEQLQTLIAAIRREAPEDASAEIKASICPYRGLLPFREEDAGFFFGREQASEDLLAKVQRHPVVAVIGRSGSGKSSLVFAGLFPELRRSPDSTTWDMMALRPGEDPLAALVREISPPPPMRARSSATPRSRTTSGPARRQRQSAAPDQEPSCRKIRHGHGPPAALCRSVGRALYAGPPRGRGEGARPEGGRRFPVHRPPPAGGRGQPAQPGVHRPRRLLR